MSEPYEVEVSVPADPQFTEQDKADLKASFTASVIEWLELKGQVDREVVLEIVMPDMEAR